MSNTDHNETVEDNRVTKDDNWVTEDDNRDDCLPSSVSLYRNQRDYNANKTIHQDVPFDKELSKSMNRTNAKRQFIDTYGESNSYLIYDFEKCKGNRLKEDVILLVLLNMGYYNNKTKRVMGFGGLNAHIYDMNESSQPHHTVRHMIPWSTHHQGIMVTTGIINGSLMLT